MKKKLLRIFLLIIMFFGIVPVTSFGNTNNDVHTVEAASRNIYFNPGVWNVDGAIFRAWVWGTGQTDKWITFTDSDGDGIFESSLDTGYTDVIFLRAQSGTSGWNGEWDRIQTNFNNNHNQYTITGWSSGNWETFYTKNIGIYKTTIYFDNSITKWSTTNIYFCVSDGTQTVTNKMTKINNTNYYKYTVSSDIGKKHFIAVIGNNSNFDSGAWGESNLTNANKYTAAYTSSYDFNNPEKYYFIKPTSNTNGTTINIEYYGNDLIKNITATALYTNKTNTNKEGNTGGSVQIQAYYDIDNPKSSTASSAGNNGTASFNDAVKLASTTFTATPETGYEFLGWFTSKDSANPIESNTVYKEPVLNEQTAYFAKFSAIKYNVIFDNGGGTGSMSSLTNKSYEETFDLPTCTFSKDGYTFAGWSGSDGKKYTDGQEVSNLTTTDGDTITLTALWYKKVTITLDAAGGQVSPSNFYSYETLSYNDSLSSLTNGLPTPTKNGYNFTGWYDGETIVTNGTIITEGKGNHTLTAHWEPIIYTITYNGLLPDSDNSINEIYNTFTIESETFTIKAPSKEYYTFLGWTGSNGESPQKEVTIEHGSTGNKTYTANWENKVTIYFDTTGVINKHKEYTVYWPFIYYFNSNGDSVEWDDKSDDGKHRFEETGKENLWKYELDFTTLDFNSIDYFVIAYYVSEGGYGNHDYVKQTTDIYFPISYQDNGKEYRIIYDEEPNFSEEDNWNINNFSIDEVINIHYYDDTTLVKSESIYSHENYYTSYPYFKEKEGYKLEGWHTSSTDFSQSTLFSHNYEFTSETPSEFNLYANYVEANDYYIYVEAKNDIGWNLNNMSVYKWSEYFDNHNNSWPGSPEGEDIVYLNNGIYRIFIDASKSFDHLIFCDITTTRDYLQGDGEGSYTVQTQNILMTPTMSYYIISSETEKDTQEGSKTYNRYLNKVYSEESVNNFIEAQKNTSSNINEFRFTSGLEDYDDLIEIEQEQIGKEFGYKFIFVRDNQSYIGYYNFLSNNIMDNVTIDNVNYVATNYGYKGYYALTLTDDITFKYNDYDQIIVVACYRTSAGNTKIIKAQEYNIINIGGTVYLFEIERQ